MSTIYDKERGALNVTLVDCEPNVVMQIRTDEKDKYGAVQIGIKIETQKQKKKKYH